MVVVGQITSPFGIKGWVKVFSHTVQPTTIFDYAKWHLQPLDQTVEIDEWQQRAKSLIAHVVGVDDRDAALALSGNNILIDANRLPKLEQGEFYWHQLEGLSVFSQVADQNLEPVKLGVISHLMATGVNDVIVIDASRDSIDQRQRLIPWLPDLVVIAIDLERRTLLVNWDINF